MYKLGITGGMGSGKSTAAHFFSMKGVTIFDADEEAKTFLHSNISIQNKIIDLFGSSMSTDNKFDLTKFSDIIFSNVSNQKIINRIIWPEIYLLMNSAANHAEQKGTNLFVVDAALLFEAGYIKFFNSILLITASKHIRIKRACKRNNIPKGQIEKRMSLQMPESKKKQLAHYTIENDGNLQEFYNNLKIFYNNLKIV